MSRSYKKHPYCTDNGKHTKYAKRLANKVYRKTEDVPNGKFYKKIFCSWNIKDYSFRKTWKQAWDYWNGHKNDKYFIKLYPSYEDYYKFWLRCYKIK